MNYRKAVIIFQLWYNNEKNIVTAGIRVFAEMDGRLRKTIEQEIATSIKGRSSKATW